MNKKNLLLMSLTISTCGLGYLGYKLYKKGFDDGAKQIGEKLFNGDLLVEETDENGKIVTKVVDPVLRKPDEVIIEDYEGVDVVHR